MSLFDSLPKPRKASAMPSILASAIAMIPHIDRFFGCYLASVQFIDRKGFGSVMATDCASKIFYDPAEMGQGTKFDTPELLACVIVHELCHIWRMDGFFCESRDPQIANIALDAVINRDMIASGYLWPGVASHGSPSTFAWRIPEEHLAGASGPIRSIDPGETALDVYRRIEQMQKDNRGNRGQGDIDMDAFRKAVEAAGGAEAFKRAIGNAIAKAEAMADRLDDAGNKDGNENDDSKDQSKPKKSKSGNSSGAHAIGHGTDGPMSEQLMQWHGLRSRKLENPLKNVVGSAVRATLTSKSKRGRTMMIPHALTDVLGYVRPGRRAIPDIRPAVAFDMSGSITRDMLVRFGQEARHWSNGLKQRCHGTMACFFNHRIADSGQLNTYLQRDNVPEPCGGTDFRPIFKEWLPSLPVAPTHLLVWTDCMGDMPDRLPRGLKVVWIVPEEYNRREYHDYEYFVNARKLGKIVYSK